MAKRDRNPASKDVTESHDARLVRMGLCPHGKYKHHGYCHKCERVLREIAAGRSVRVPFKINPLGRVNEPGKP
jgi:hypothetical protein